ncbi:DUF2162 domain-containing protein [Inediibacterium massiliense]|uniref:DUF2162 domain-containing protein n=1 Tax=Inediibacterium massiliense TaxID=1658111 RepID=UPI0006B68CAB|nr:DUF2162 domain-containing protein [Inediibacterium massiliense]
MWTAIFTMMFALFVLSVKTGMILGVSSTNKRYMALISFLFSLVLYFLSIFLTSHMKYIAHFIDRYTFVGSMMLSVFLIYLGLHHSSSQKESMGHKILAYLPCPFCLLAMSISVMLTKGQLKRTDHLLEMITAILFFVFILLVGFGMKWMIDCLNINPSSIFNSILIFFGIFTLLLGLFIPNYVSAAKMGFSPIKVDSLKILKAVFVGMTGVTSIGFIQYKIKN